MLRRTSTKIFSEKTDMPRHHGHDLRSSRVRNVTPKADESHDGSDYLNILPWDMAQLSFRLTSPRGQFWEMCRRSDGCNDNGTWCSHSSKRKWRARCDDDDRWPHSMRDWTCSCLNLSPTVPEVSRTRVIAAATHRDIVRSHLRNIEADTSSSIMLVLSLALL